MRDKLNEELKKDRQGQCLEIGGIFIQQQNAIFLQLRQIKVDYQTLLNNDQISGVMDEYFGGFSILAKTAARMATILAPNTVEKRGLDLLQREENKAHLLNLIKGALYRHGIKLELDEIQLMRNEDGSADAIESNRPFTLSEKMENDIILAFANYLRDNISNSLVLAE